MYFKRVVDDTLTEVPATYLGAVFAHATRHLAYMSHPAPQADGDVCTTVMLSGRWDLVDELAYAVSTTELSPTAQEIQYGVIRYCVSTAKFLRCTGWDVRAHRDDSVLDAGFNTTPAADGSVADCCDSQDGDEATLLAELEQAEAELADLQAELEISAKAAGSAIEAASQVFDHTQRLGMPDDPERRCQLLLDAGELSRDAGAISSGRVDVGHFEVTESMPSCEAPAAKPPTVTKIATQTLEGMSQGGISDSDRDPSALHMPQQEAASACLQACKTGDFDTCWSDGAEVPSRGDVQGDEPEIAFLGPLGHRLCFQNNIGESLTLHCDRKGGAVALYRPDVDEREWLGANTDGSLALVRTPTEWREGATGLRLAAQAGCAYIGNTLRVCGRTGQATVANGSGGTHSGCVSVMAITGNIVIVIRAMH